MEKNPTGKVPFLETDAGCIFTSNAIARYIARCRAGLSAKQINEHDEIKKLVNKLNVLRTPAVAKASPKAAPAGSPKGSPKAAPAAAPGGVDEAAIKRVGDEIRTLKEKLKGEGLSGKKIN